MSDDDSAWHRRFAADLFNRTWDLMDMPSRSPAQDSEMLTAAFASRHHWGVVGTVENRITGDWQIARVSSLLGMADLALRFAGGAAEAAHAEGWTGWRLASVYEGMARAHACAGARAERDRYVGLAEKALAEEPDADDRDEIARQLATVP